MRGRVAYEGMKKGMRIGGEKRKGDGSSGREKEEGG